MVVVALWKNERQPLQPKKHGCAKMPRDTDYEYIYGKEPVCNTGLCMTGYSGYGSIDMKTGCEIGIQYANIVVHWLPIINHSEIRKGE